jgi:hypothetical protein
VLGRRLDYLGTGLGDAASSVIDPFISVHFTTSALAAINAAGGKLGVESIIQLTCSLATTAGLETRNTQLLMLKVVIPTSERRIEQGCEEPLPSPRRLNDRRGVHERSLVSLSRRPSCQRVPATLRCRSARRSGETYKLSRADVRCTRYSATARAYMLVAYVVQLGRQVYRYARRGVGRAEHWDGCPRSP